VMTAVMEVGTQSWHTGTPISAGAVALLGARPVATPHSAQSGPTIPNSEIPRLESYLTRCKQRVDHLSNSEKNDIFSIPLGRGRA